MAFTTAQVEQLSAKLDERRVHVRKQKSKQRDGSTFEISLSYLEAFDVFDKANEIFGFHGWQYRTTRIEKLALLWHATVCLRVLDDTGTWLEREDIGLGIAAVDSDSAHETAAKAAVTDALKRAFRTYGNAFGNSLYDKDRGKEIVEDQDEEGGRRATTRSTSRGNPPTEKQVNYVTKLIREAGQDEYTAWLLDQDLPKASRVGELTGTQVSALIQHLKTLTD